MVICPNECYKYQPASDNPLPPCADRGQHKDTPSIHCTVYRVVTKYRNGTERPIVERGPWHTSHKTADYWADLLRAQGYDTSVESDRGLIPGDGGMDDDHSALADALSSMA